MALAVAVVTALALSTAALADDAGDAGNIGGVAQAGSITINNAVNNQTYSIYRMLDLDDHNSDYTAITYKVNANWAEFFAVGAEGRNYVDIDDQGYVTWKDGVDESAAAQLAADAIAYATANGIAPLKTAVAANSTVSFTDLELGYYLVQSGLGTICSLDTTLADVVILEKNGKPTIDKEVQENPAGTWGKTNDANVGDTVYFRTTVTVLDGNPLDYVVTDEMSAGLSFTGQLTVKVNDVAKTAGTDYTLAATDSGFTLSFVNGVLKPNDVILIEYSATLNANAVVASTGNPNKTYLEYNDHADGKGKTQEVETRTYTWPIDVFKYTKNGTDDAALEGAEFQLTRVNGNVTEYAQADLKTGTDEATYKITGWATVESEGTTFESPKDGKFVVEGLDTGTYKLTEIKPPAGYNTLKDPITITITAAIDGSTHVGTPTVTYNETSTGTINVENKTGSELPSTGGMGTTVLYIVGGILVVGAAVALVTRKRMGNK